MTDTTTAAPVLPSVPTVLTPIGIDDATLTGGFLADLQLRNADAILAHTYEWLERAGWTENFRLAASGALPAGRQGREFSDSEIYKVLEAHSWESARTGDPVLEQRIAELTAVIAGAMEPDGYVNTMFGRPGQAPRYSDLEWGHELYCYGHLLQAAVARGRTVGLDDPLVEIGRRVADHVLTEFGPDARNGLCGHPSVELGLMEFGRLTGEQRYLDQAALFLERRGHGLLPRIQFKPEYFQDDIPIREATVLRGHAVRALYLSAAAVDSAVETADSDLLAVLEAQWERTVARRTYITGGMGSHHEDEGFGQDWELPSDRAYCESCAGVAAWMMSWRLLLATGDERYADLMERVFYNVIATSPGADGHAFFYANTLHQRHPGTPVPDGQLSRVGGGVRGAWYEVSCCPPNVSRTLASLGAYLATTSSDGIQLHHYASARLELDLDAGPVELEVAADYPRSGVIEVTVVDAAAPFTLTLRVPPWAAGATLESPAGLREGLPAGTVEVEVSAGDVVTLTLPIAPRFTFPDSRIDGIRGTVAVERGPEVYCLESVDLPAGRDVDEFVVDPSVPATDGPDGTVIVSGAVLSESGRAWPYGAAEDSPPSATLITPLLPYHDWANRGPSGMRIWLRRE